MRYTQRDQNDCDTLKEFFNFVIDDIKKVVGVSLSAVEQIR